MSSDEAEALIRDAVGGVDLERAAREFREQDGFIFLPRFFAEPATRRMVDESRAMPRKGIRRTFVPRLRKGGASSYADIARNAPFLHAIYRSPSLREFVGRLSGAPLAVKHDHDAHAAALYFYEKPGDHVTYHYDDCGCEGASYTAIFGVVNDTRACRLHVQLHAQDEKRPRKELYLSTEPGDFVFFRGNSVYHRITPLARGEKRISYSFAYVKEGHHAQGYKLLRTRVKDAFLYFGLKAFFQKK